MQTYIISILVILIIFIFIYATFSSVKKSDRDLSEVKLAYSQLSLNIDQKEQRYYETSIVHPHLIELEKEDNISSIKKELKTLQEDNWKEWPETELWKQGNARWTVFALFAFGKWSDDSIKFPRLTRLLKRVPGLRTAGFSRMAPGTTLKVHTGYAGLANYALRSHLLLTEHPEGLSSIWVEGEIRPHKLNKWITFDDSLEHSGSNLDSKDRILLLVDVDRPSFVPEGRSNVRNSSELDSFVDSI